MSTKLNFIQYAKSLLENASARTTDNDVAGRLNAIARTAESVPDGYWARIEPLYEPLSPQLQKAVRDLNSAIIAGQRVPDFGAYISTLVASL